MARKRKTEAKQAREFAITLPVVFGVLALVMSAPQWLSWLPWQAKPRAILPLLIAGPLVCFVALIVPGLWLRFFRLWMKFGNALSWLMTRVILTAFFFLILTPFVLILRLFGKKLLDLAWHDEKPTYWIDREEVEASLDRYRKQF